MWCACTGYGIACTAHLVALARRLAESEEHGEGRAEHEEIARIEGQRRPLQRIRPRPLAPRVAPRVSRPRGVSGLRGLGGLAAALPPSLGEVLMGDEVKADHRAEGVREEGDLPGEVRVCGAVFEVDGVELRRDLTGEWRLP